MPENIVPSVGRDEVIRKALLDLQPKMNAEGSLAESEIVARAAELGAADVTSAEIQLALDREAERRFANAPERRQQAIEWLLSTAEWFDSEIAFTRDLFENNEEGTDTITLMVRPKDVEIIQKNLRHLASALMEGSI
jgi:hypothetical protein